MEFTFYDSVCVVENEGLVRNLNSNLTRGLSLCEPVPVRSGRLAICGSGPSLRDYLHELKDHDEIWAINGAYGYLLDENIVPHGFMGVDPLPGLAEYVQRAQPDTTFYVSVLCDPSILDTLKGHKIKLWCPAQKSMKFPKGSWLVPGSTTALTCAPFLAKMMGWREVTIFGADCSFDPADGRRYAYENGTYTEDNFRDTEWVWIGDQAFPTELCLVKQASMLAVLADWPGVKLSFRCGGLLDAHLKAPMYQVPPDAEFKTPDAA